MVPRFSSPFDFSTSAKPYIGSRAETTMFIMRYSFRERPGTSVVDIVPPVRSFVRLGLQKTRVKAERRVAAVAQIHAFLGPAHSAKLRGLQAKDALERTHTYG